MLALTTTVQQPGNEFVEGSLRQRFRRLRADSIPDDFPDDPVLVSPSEALSGSADHSWIVII